MFTLYAKIYSKKAQLIIWVLFIMLWILTIVRPVQAQSLTLSILPAEETITLNGTNSVTLMVEVANVVDLNAFDVGFTYDPTMIQLTKWEHGGFLSNLSQFGVYNNPGSLRLVFAQLQTPGVTGSGTLLKLTFSAQSYGTSIISLSRAILSNSGGIKMYPAVFHSNLSTVYDPAIVANSAVNGTFSLQGQTNTGGVTVTLSNGQFLNRGNFSGTSLNLTGINLTINPVVMDLYTITTAKPRYLNVDSSCGKTKAVFGTTTTLSPLRLISGNAVWTDNEINIQDVTLVLGVFGEPSTTINPLDADVNFDGMVNTIDLVLVGGHYGLTCSLAYADWEP